ncbi:MAG: hypothetical protein NTV34_19795, partial [Proteobacteria bacterium]|nr:hypothetical protein [Pseudomonadota bacterium]
MSLNRIVLLSCVILVDFAGCKTSDTTNNTLQSTKSSEFDSSGGDGDCKAAPEAKLRLSCVDTDETWRTDIKDYVIEVNGAELTFTSANASRSYSDEAKFYPYQT